MISSNGSLCRACTRECEPSDLNNFQGKSLIYSELTAIEVTAEDDLPKHLCQICCRTLDEFKTFKELCRKSIQIFRNSIVFKEEESEASFERNADVLPGDHDQSIEELDFKHGSPRRKRRKKKMPRTLKLEPKDEPTSGTPNCRTCHICHKSLSSSSTLKRHLSTHSQKCFDCLECNKTFRHEGSFKIHMEKHEGQSFICDKCGKVFQSKRMIQTHLRCHESMDPEKCNHCSETFPSKRELDRHKINQHFNYKRTTKECLVCGKKCKKLLPHQRKFHTVYTTTENLHACHLCSMKLKSKDGLRTHIRKTHIEERNHQCPECPKRFKDASMLKKHRYFHSGERPVHCEVCSKGFYTKWSLNVHMNVHKKQWMAEGVQGLKLFEYAQKKTVT